MKTILELCSSFEVSCTVEGGEISEQKDENNEYVFPRDVVQMATALSMFS